MDISSFQSHLETAEPTHLVTHIRQNSKNQVRKIITQDPETKETTRKARMLQSFANKKIALILRADLEKTFGETVSQSVLDKTTYEKIVMHGLLVSEGLAFYTKAAALS